MLRAASNIALIGFRATGKTTVGRLTAEKRGCTFIDMDAELVDSFGSDIQSWVATHGWESFRLSETELLDRLAVRTNLVLATGGGVILEEKNRRLLKDRFFVVWLRASLETIVERLTNDPKTALQRPSLTALPLREEIETLLAVRAPLYQETAELILDTDCATPRELAETVLRAVTGPGSEHTGA